MYVTFHPLDYSPENIVQFNVGADTFGDAIVTVKHNGHDPNPIMCMVCAS